MPPKPKAKKVEEEAAKPVKVQISDDQIRAGLCDMAPSLGRIPVK